MVFEVVSNLAGPGGLVWSTSFKLPCPAGGTVQWALEAERETSPRVVLAELLGPVSPCSALRPPKVVQFQGRLGG